MAGVTGGSLELIAAATAFFATTKVTAFRHVKKYALPVGGGAFILYRVLTHDPTLPGNNTILAEILRLVEALSLKLSHSKNGLATRLVHDALGLLLCSACINAALVPTSRASMSFSLRDLKEYVYSLVQDLPAVRREVAKEAAKLEKDLEAELKSKSRAMALPCSTLPPQGLARADILQLMRAQTAIEDVVWQQGRVSGAVYHGDAEHNDFLNKAFALYSIANPLHPDVWPSAMKFESEVIAMTAALVSGGCESVCGCTTSGGTESIVLAIKAHRDYYKRTLGIDQPELVCCSSAHAAVDKACDLLGVRLVKLPMGADYRADVALFRQALSPNTILLYASAPSYPQGAIDDVEALSKLARSHGIGLHVDCCLGGFVLPFMQRLGGAYAKDLGAFDFSLPGVTSMSLDTHKYGYALKGASVVLYRTRELRQAQYFCYGDWTGGMYTTPTIAGSRSAGLIAQCWASLVSVGEEGYLRHTKDIIDCTRAIREGCRDIAGLVLCGKCDAMIVCVAADKAEGLNIYTVADGMTKRGWSLNSLQNPASLHICVTVRHVGQDQAFLSDLRASVLAARLAKADGSSLEGKAAIYGTTAGLPSGPVNSLLRVYNDVVLKV